MKTANLLELLGYGFCGEKLSKKLSLDKIALKKGALN